jgi:hypothetical protein
MGCCFSQSNGDHNDHEVEINFNTIHKKKGGESAAKEEPVLNQCSCGKMSPAMQTDSNSGEITGYGTLLGSCPLDCDTARWEVVIGKNITSTEQIQIGIKRYFKHVPNDHLLLTMEQANSDSKQSNSPANETIGFYLSDSSLSLKEGDVIGVYWDQTDLPMLQFSYNGNVLMSQSVNRIRPSNDMYVAVSLVPGASEGEGNNNNSPSKRKANRSSSSSNGSFKLLFHDHEFKYPSIASKFHMIICSTKLI